MILDAIPAQKALPHSQESERAVLGAILMDPPLIEDVAADLAPGDLYSERHLLIYSAMLSLWRREVEIDLRTLQAELEAKDQLARVGGLAYLTGLDLDLPDPGRVALYVEIIRDRALRRSVIGKAGETIRAMLDGGETDTRAAAGRLMGDLDAALAGRQKGEGFVDGARGADEWLMRLETLSETKGPAEGPRFGIASFDRYYEAFEPGRLVLVGGRSGTGKTAALVQFLVQDVRARERSAVVSLEQRRYNLFDRMAAHHLSIDGKRVAKARITSDDFRRAMGWARELQRLRSPWIDDQPVRRVPEIVSAVRRLHRQEKVRRVYIDYLSLITRERKARAHEEMEELAYELARLAASLEITVVALVQLNRGPANENRVPRLSDIREAGEQAAWYVVLLHREAVLVGQGQTAEEEQMEATYGPNGLMILAKNRDGTEGSIKAFYDGPRLRWWDRAEWESHGKAMVEQRNRNLFDEGGRP